MYLSIMLIIVTALVFYNEIQSNMNIAEILLLGISFIAISRASLNYINITDTTNEGFTSSSKKHNIPPSRKHINNNVAKQNKHTENDIINLLSSSKSKTSSRLQDPNKYNEDYFDTNRFFILSSMCPILLSL